MKNIEIAILNYENQLLANRRQLNDLIYECQKENINHVLLNDKINHLQNEIEYMNQQLYLLKSDLQKEKVVSETVIQNKIPQNNMAQPQNGMSPFPNNMAQPQNQTAKKRDFENIIGKSWMGIFASVLIFISLILFATLLAPFITDTIKMVAMYVVSIAFTGFGLFKLKKYNNKFYLAISSCGVGAIYISLLLSHLYFKAIGYIVLYLLILIWAVFVCYLAKLKDKVFQIIGQCGITISLFFGCLLCGSTQDTMKLFMLTLFFVLTATLFFVSSMQKEFDKNRINYVFHCINVFQLWVTITGMNDADWYTGLSGVVVLAFLIAQFVFFFWSDIKENSMEFAIYVILNDVFALLFLYEMIASSSICGIVFIVVAVSLLAGTEWKFKQKNNDGKIILQVFHMILLIPSIYSISFFEQHVGCVVIMLPILIIGYLKKDNIYKCGSLCMACIYMFSDLSIAEHLGFGVLYFGVLAYFLYTKKEQYNGVFKLFSYGIAFVYLYRDVENLLRNVNGDISVTIAYSVFGILNVLAMKSLFVKNFKTWETEKESLTVTGILNAIFMFLHLQAIADVENIVCHVILILVAILLFVANTKNLLTELKGVVPGFYIGIKLTLLVIVILNSFDAVNYMISISLFLFAILSIVIGFKFAIKAFRLYGLILSMISIVKLIMIDISYENTLGHALSFFVCGILCFVISMIYNVIDKKLGE